MSINPPPAAATDAVVIDARAEMLRVIELRRVDRLQALLKGPAPATTMSLVLDRLRKALRPEDRLAALSDEQVCVVLPRLAHPSHETH